MRRVRTLPLQSRVGAQEVSPELVAFWPASLRVRLSLVPGCHWSSGGGDESVGSYVGRLRGKGELELANVVLTATQWWLNVKARS